MLLKCSAATIDNNRKCQENYGDVENKGFEVQLSTHNVKSTNFNGFTELSWSTNKNTIKKLWTDGSWYLMNSWVGGANTILRVGESIATFFGLTRPRYLQYTGSFTGCPVWICTGDVKYFDKNGDGLISYVSDGDLLGSAFPKWDMDFTNNFDYKRFDASIDIRFFLMVPRSRTGQTIRRRQAGDG